MVLNGCPLNKFIRYLKFYKFFVAWSFLSEKRIFRELNLDEV